MYPYRKLSNQGPVTAPKLLVLAQGPLFLELDPE